MFLNLFIASIFSTPIDPPPLPVPRSEAPIVAIAAAPVPAVVVSTSTQEFVPDDGLPICNCYLEVKKFIPNLPRTKDLIPNSPARAGAVAIYNYHGTPHYALVLDVYHDGTYSHLERGSNLKRCQFYTRVVNEDNQYLVGYWYPPELALASP
jgi:hypothetical protein